MKLNLGCGDFPMKGWTNVDSSPLPQVDIVADVRHLPSPDDSIDEIYAGHILEHIPITEADATLAEWLRVLLPGGRLTIACPDTRYLAREYLEGRISCRTLSEVYMHVESGRQRHHACFDADDVSVRLAALGAEAIEVLPVETCELLVARVPWQFVVTAVKPLTPRAATFADATRGARVGIGVITKDRCHLLRELMPSLISTTRALAPVLYVSDDGSSDGTSEYLNSIGVTHDNTPAGGVASNKTRALARLMEQGCDYLFLLEDDVIPVREGWCETLVYAMKNGPEKHLNFIPADKTGYKTIRREKIAGNLTLAYQSGLTGLLMCMTREVVETLGGFCRGFDPYGYEHIDYTLRASRAGFCDTGCGFAHVEELDHYLNWKKEEPSTMTEAAKRPAIERACALYEKRCAEGVIHTPFTCEATP